MNLQNSTGPYKKFKTNTNQQIPTSQWDSFTRNKQNAAVFKKRPDQEEDGLWIGTQSTPPHPSQLQNSYINQSFQKRQPFSQNTPKSLTSNEIQSKTPTQIIQSILKGLANNNKLTTINPYYSEQTEQKLTQILTNQNKLQSYISQLQTQIGEVDQSVAKNYQMLIMLLRHIGKSDVEIKHSSNGLQLNFNRNIIMKQENQIEKLQKKIKEKDEHIKQIIQEYQSVIRNFNDVIQKLLEQRISQQHPHHQSNGNHHQYHRKNNR